MALKVRAAVPGDEEIICRIEAACFAEPLTRQQVFSQLQNGMYHLVLVMDGEDTVFGYAGMYSVLDEGYITNVAVLPDHRRKHAADRLMEELLRLSAAGELAFLTLEVRQGNSPARALYTKHGFAVKGIRKNYYTNPKEDAVIMTFELK